MQPGMDVYSADEVKIGTIDGVVCAMPSAGTMPRCMLLVRAGLLGLSNLSIPDSMVYRVDEERVVLLLTKAELDQGDWRSPS